MKLNFRRAQKIGALATAMALASLLAAGPAQAHDALASSNPSNGDTVTTNPGKVSITLTKAPNTDLPDSSIIKVTAPDGHVVSTGKVTADGPTLSIAADIDHPGEHTVEWRTVSADGHPIDGKFTFTYAEAGASAAATPTTATAESVENTEQAATTTVNDTEPDNTVWYIGGGIVLLALVIIGAYALGRRKKIAADHTD
ncbi:copper resistance protein CopC [Arthrobacter psychrolactophilus]|uniref:Copper resistance protein CopC n=1 Tax=Arthrobacter psychrolactophilus TaxID=92442 RepID=A0A2V5INT9_9MICC|nr:copper resistance CopC family protein [Arthrobacter psychrolactophilus]PYI38225.1 copper resistance protein CopC [Arthrobacter psychrolactophilus]